MPRLTAEQFRRVEALFFEASSLPVADRDRFLATACGDDGDVRDEVQSMLAHSGSSGDRIGDTILDDAIASLIAAPASPKATESLLRQLIGTRVGAYEFTDILGRGGMGVVYLARDMRLGRTVAIKALPPGFSRHSARMSRFVREAKILASLSHPNVATVFGLEESAGMKFLVMECVEGETLARRLRDGTLPLDEAIRVVREVAAGVEAAHAAGVIHRDLKPGNVMFKPDGKVKVLDFGLAREVGARIVDAAASSAEVGSRAEGGDLTLEGSVVGTPGYMSPEQLRGKSVDRRTDVFALGCIFYECLTGKLAFPGETGADVIAGILERDPNWALLPPSTPTSVRRLLVRCVAKDPDDRMRDVGDVRLELEEALALKEWINDAPQSQLARSRWAAWALPLGLSAVLLGSTVFILRRPAVTPASATAQPLRRFSLQFPQDVPQSNLAQVRLALSHDGGRIVAAASDGQEQHLWVRDRADVDFRKLDGTLNATAPALSPDGDWVAYFGEGMIWKRRVGAGNPVKLVDASSDWGGCRWDADHHLTYAVARGGGLARVADEGGAATIVTVPRGERGESVLSGGYVLPDGSGALFAVRDGNPEPRIEAQHLASGRRHTVVEHGSTPNLARTPWGTFLLWERAGTVYAATFDPASLKLTGREVAVADGVLTNRAALYACYDVADDGTLAYVPGPVFTEENRLAWVDTGDFDGPAAPLGDERMSFADPRFSADGRRISVLVKGDRYRPYVYDVSRGSLDRVIDTGDCTSAAISPDGRRLAYATNRDGPCALWLRDLVDGTEQVLTQAGAGRAGDLHWSPDGKALAYSLMRSGSTRRDVWVLDVESKTAVAFCDGRDVDERSARFSPNGNWLAFVSNESGAPEVYVKSFPSGKSVRQVSTGSGGTRPEWTSDGRKLYYRGKGGLYLAPIATNWADGSRPAIISRRHFGQSDSDLADYAVAPDGRLLVVEPSERRPTATQVTVVLNWHQLLNPAPPNATPTP